MFQHLNILVHLPINLLVHILPPWDEKKLCNFWPKSLFFCVRLQTSPCITATQKCLVLVHLALNAIFQQQIQEDKSFSVKLIPNSTTNVAKSVCNFCDNCIKPYKFPLMNRFASGMSTSVVLWSNIME